MFWLDGMNLCTLSDRESELTFGYSYYSDAVLGGVHRIMAIQQWVRLKDGQPVPLEKALAAFDQFVLHDREGDLEEVSSSCILYYPVSTAANS